MFSLEGPEGFEPTITELQSAALTELGYGPIYVLRYYPFTVYEVDYLIFPRIYLPLIKL